MDRKNDSEDAKIFGQPIPKPRGDSINDPAAVKREEKKAVEQPTIPSTARDGDTVFGQPVSRPRTDGGAKLILDETVWGSESHQNDESDLVLERSFRVPRLRIPGHLITIVLLVCALLALFIYSQVLIVITSINKMPVVFQIGVYVVGISILVLLGMSVFRLVQAFRRLPKGRQLTLKMKQIQAGNKKYPSTVLDKAREILQKYLNEYPSENDALERLGYLPDEIEGLIKARRQLSDTRPVDTYSWIEDFERMFCSVQDKCANRKIRTYARLVALKTVISPNALLDAAAALYNNAHLVRDLMLVYNVRTEKYDSLYVFGWIIANTFIAGQVEDLSEELVEEWTDVAAEQISGAASNIIKKLASKTAEGAANYFFTRRIGKKARQLLRPIST